MIARLRWTAVAVVMALLAALAATTVRSAPVAVRPAADQMTSGHGTKLAGQLAAARAATAKYSTHLGRAKKDGYQIITQEMPGMGYHYLNPNIAGFDVKKPQILVYEHVGTRWQLGALEWVFPSVPTTPPLPDATYGEFPAACHYANGEFVPADSESSCADRHDGSKFSFWHPELFTMHVWVWYPNPTGLYASTNPYVAPFNKG